jgi:hypothetical protein
VERLQLLGRGAGGGLFAGSAPARPRRLGALAHVLGLELAPSAWARFSSRSLCAAASCSSSMRRVSSASGCPPPWSACSRRRRSWTDLVEPRLERLQLSVTPGELGPELELALLRLRVLVAEVSHQLLGGVKLGAEPHQLVALDGALTRPGERLAQLLLHRLHLGGEGPGLRVLGRVDVRGRQHEAVGVLGGDPRCHLRPGTWVGELDHRRTFLSGELGEVLLGRGPGGCSGRGGSRLPGRGGRRRGRGPDGRGRGGGRVVEGGVDEVEVRIAGDRCLLLQHERGLLRRAGEAGHDGDRIRDVQRLRQVLVRAILEPGVRLEALGVPHDDDRDGLEPLVLLELADEEIAVLATGQVHGQHDRARLPAPHQVDDAAAVGRLLDGVAALLERGAETAGKGGVSLDDQTWVGIGGAKRLRPRTHAGQTSVLEPRGNQLERGILRRDGQHRQLPRRRHHLGRRARRARSGRCPGASDGGLPRPCPRPARTRAHPSASWRC